MPEDKRMALQRLGGGVLGRAGATLVERAAWCASLRCSASLVTAEASAGLGREGNLHPPQGQVLSGRGQDRAAGGASAAVAERSAWRPPLPLEQERPRAARRPLSTMSGRDFHYIADETLESLQEQLEELLEDEGVEESDVTCDSGVLQVDLPDEMTYVINKQAPNKQIWLSSPVSGPFRYDWRAEEGAWVYSRDGHTIHDKLSEELSDLLGVNVRIL